MSFFCKNLNMKTIPFYMSVQVQHRHHLPLAITQAAAIQLLEVVLHFL
jgi:hypothetical protein